MKDYLKGVVDSAQGQLIKTCVAREYLQARILQMLQEAGSFQNWAFVGGTSLRFLYSIPRFSEDLDFSVIDTSNPANFREALNRIKSGFENEAYQVNLTIKDEKTVASAFVKFPGLLRELGLSPHASQALSVKVELDLNPPQGAKYETTLVRRHVVLNILHHDKPSLFAGKLHALMTRRYTKGRDLYDLIWYLTDKALPEPNLKLLNAALKQTEWNGPVLTKNNWRDYLAKKLSSINWKTAKDDALPFLEHEADANLITQENVLGLLKSKNF